MIISLYLKTHRSELAFVAFLTNNVYMVKSIYNIYNLFTICFLFFLDYLVLQCPYA